jgi:hypothetical protein
VTGIYGGLQPGVSIPSEITRLTDITDDMVVGQSIDMTALQALIAPADLLIAHNAGFDRPFCGAFSHLFRATPRLALTLRSTGRRADIRARSLQAGYTTASTVYAVTFKLLLANRERSIHVILFEQQSADEADDGVFVGKDADHLRAPFDLTIQALDGICAVKLGPVLLGKVM